LQNAGSASRLEGEISIHVALNNEAGQLDFLLIQVSDSGAGISQQDLPRLFSRLYRDDNTLIQGVGDTSVGLSVVKTLVEAQGGRIWVESEIGKGSTFSILLPVISGEVSGEKSGE
jgi:signal transduction histidine kinase